MTLWAAVDELTQDRRVKLWRDDGTTNWPTIPSLWWQLTEAIASSSALDGGGTGNRYRAPLDLTCMELAKTITETTIDALTGHDEKPCTVGASPERIAICRAQRAAERSYGLKVNLTPIPEPSHVLVPASLRALASAVTRTADNDLEAWWTYCVRSWCRQIRVALRLGEPLPRGIRGTACPACGETTATVKRDDDTVRVPALVVDFTPDGYIRAAECLRCHAAWFRGAALWELSDATRTKEPA